MLSIALVLVLVAGLGLWFLRLERCGREPTVLVIVLALLLAELILYPSQNEIPEGIFHPGSGALTFRLPEAVIAVALAARLWARAGASRIGVRMLWWGAWSAWIATAGLLGVLQGNRFDLVTFEAKAVVYVAGGVALAAGVDAGRLIRHRGLHWLVAVAAAAAVLLTLTDQAGVEIAAGVPMLPLDDLGRVDGDLATVFTTLGCLSVALAFCQRQGATRWLIMAVPLFVAPIASEQRAAILAGLVSVAVLALGAVAARHRIHRTPTEMGLAIMLAAALLLGPSFARAVVGGGAYVPFQENVETILNNQAKLQSAESRVNQLREVRHEIADRPVLGWGLGKEYTYYEQGPDEMWKSNYTHNIGTDLLLRAGLVGLLLFAMATAVTMADGWRSWRRHPDVLVAALGLAAVAAVAGILAKGMVESIFEKYRIAALLGLTLGLCRSARTAAVTEPGQPEPATVGAAVRG